jgi:hypothetical protein
VPIHPADDRIKTDVATDCLVLQMNSPGRASLHSQISNPHSQNGREKRRAS